MIFSDKCVSVVVTPYSTLMFWRLMVVMLAWDQTEVPKIETAGSHVLSMAIIGYLIILRLTSMGNSVQPTILL
jgi:hypothetical protein